MLKKLKAAYDQAKAALAAKPDDEALKAKLEAAKSAYEAALVEAANDDEDESDDEDEESEDDAKSKKKKKEPASGEQGDKEPEEDLDELLKDPAKAKAYLKSLRKENAKYRTKGKNLEERFSQFEKGLKTLLGQENEDDGSTPEEKLKAVSHRSQVAEYKAAVLEKAIENGISGKDGRELFEFYLNKAAEGLEEGEELSDDDIAQVALKVRKMTSGQKKAKTSVGGGEEENPEGDDETTLDEFAAMTVSEKTTLSIKKPEVYNRLFKEAVVKRRL